MKSVIRVAAVLAAVWVVTPGCVVDTESEDPASEADELGTASDELSKISCRQYCRTEKGAAKLKCLAQCVRYETAKVCRTDSDCNLYADFCGGCYCDSLNRPLPSACAPEDQVYCFADPCMTKQPVCVQGRCLPY